MFPLPSWLPPIINTDGVWEKILKLLYKIFKTDFIIDKCYFEIFKVIYDQRKIDSPYEEGFWKLITRENKESKERFPDFPRAQRLPWCKPIIINHKDSANVREWDYKESNGRVNTYLWLEDHNYLVIIQKRRAVAFLVSAHHIDGMWKKQQLINKYGKRVI